MLPVLPVLDEVLLAALPLLVLTVPLVVVARLLPLVELFARRELDETPTELLLVALDAVVAELAPVDSPPLEQAPTRAAQKSRGAAAIAHKRTTSHFERITVLALSPRVPARVVNARTRPFDPRAMRILGRGQHARPASSRPT